MRPPSYPPWFVQLEQHGLSSGLLERLCTFCTTRKTGSFVFHVSQGHIVSYEEQHRTKVQASDVLPTVTVPVQPE